MMQRTQLMRSVLNKMLGSGEVEEIIEVGRPFMFM
jgi:hypothetical protein